MIIQLHICTFGFENYFDKMHFHKNEYELDILGFQKINIYQKSQFNFLKRKTLSCSLNFPYKNSMTNQPMFWTIYDDM